MASSTEAIARDRLAIARDRLELVKLARANGVDAKVLANEIFSLMLKESDSGTLPPAGEMAVWVADNQNKVDYCVARAVLHELLDGL